MDPLAINQTVVDRKLFAEGYAATFPKRRQSVLFCCGAVFFAVGLLLRALQQRLPAAGALSVPATLTGIATVIWALTLRRSELRRKYKVFRRKNGETSARTIRCYPTHLTVETEGAPPLRIDYAEIRERRETQHLLILICKNRSGILLAKDGFRRGSACELFEAIERVQDEGKAQDKGSAEEPNPSVSPSASQLPLQGSQEEN